MGLGGHLMWTAVFRNIQEQTGQKIFVCRKPGLSDLLRGCLYDRAFSFADDVVFRHNPRLIHPVPQPKAAWEEQIDYIWQRLLRRLRLEGLYERFVHALAQKSRVRYAHIDMNMHHYVEKELPDRYIWREGGHAVDIALRNFGLKAVDYRPELYFTPEEEEEAQRVQAEHGLQKGRYICIEPHTKTDFFGDLRSWPFARWQAVVDSLTSQANFPYRFVQLGDGGKPALYGVVDLCVSFRMAAAIMRDAVLFLGTDGGLMHAAAAVNANAIILWGGLISIELVGYKQLMTILHKDVPCAPCGRKGVCPNQKVCMMNIGVAEVVAAVQEQLAKRRTL